MVAGFPVLLLFEFSLPTVVGFPVAFLLSVPLPVAKVVADDAVVFVVPSTLAPFPVPKIKLMPLF